MKITILDGYSINPGDLSWDALKELGELTVYDDTADDEILSHIGDSEAIFTSKIKMTRGIMEKCPNLKFIGELATGYDNIDLEAAKEFGIAVYNTPAYSTESVAQHTFALLLEICNQVALHTDAVNKGKWYDSTRFCFWESPIIQLAGKSIGIIGYGAIGRKVGEIAEAIGMKVNPYTGPGKKYDNLEAAITSDVVTFHCPATEQTTNMVDAEFISKMKDGAILLNCARGAIVDEQALADALKSGKLYGAGIDVLRKEPPARPNPLVGIPNCFITPHIAWFAKDARAIVCETTYLNLKSFLEGGEKNRIA